MNGTMNFRMTVHGVENMKPTDINGKKNIFITDNKDPVTYNVAEYLEKTAAEKYNVLFNNVNIKIDVCHIAPLNDFFGSFEIPAVIIPAPWHNDITIEEASDSDFDQAFNDGALVSMLVTRAASECFKKNKKGGAVIYLGSIHAEKATDFDFLYSIQCGATQMICREAVIAYGEYNVNYYYVQRGILTHDVRQFNNASNIYTASDLRYPKKKIPGTDSLNGLISFLLTEAAAPLSGSDLKADGGLTMYYGNRGDGR